MSDSLDERVDEHVVFFTTALGDPAAERYPSLRSAVSRVESLCNEDDVRDAKVFQLVPVPLAVRPYFRVEVETAPTSHPNRAAEPDRDEAPAAVSREVRDPRDPRDPRDEVPDQREQSAEEVLHRTEEPRPMREARRPMRDEIVDDGPAVSGDQTRDQTRDEVSDKTDAEPTSDRGRSLGFFVR